MDRLSCRLWPTNTSSCDLPYHTRKYAHVVVDLAWSNETKRNERSVKLAHCRAQQRYYLRMYVDFVAGLQLLTRADRSFLTFIVTYHLRFLAEHLQSLFFLTLERGDVPMRSAIGSTKICTIVIFESAMQVFLQWRVLGAVSMMLCPIN